MFKKWGLGILNIKGWGSKRIKKRCWEEFDSGEMY